MRSIIANIDYAIKNIWKWDKGFLVFFIPTIPFAVILPFVVAYFPKVLIDSVGAEDSLQSILLIVAIYFASITAITLINQFCTSRLQMRQYNITLHYQNAISEKHMRTDFANTADPDVINKYKYAMGDACSGQCAPEFIFQSLSSLLISLIGIFTYGTAISIVSPWILLALFASAIVSFLVARWQKNYVEKNKKKWVEIDRKIDYLQGFSRKFDYAKDIRIFGMTGWLSEMLAGYQNDRFAWTKKVSVRTLIGTILNALLALLRNGLAYAILINMVINDKIGAGDFVFYFGMITGFSAWLNDISKIVNDISHKSIKIGYYRDYFNIDEKFNHGRGCELPRVDELPVSLELKGVSFIYPSEKGEKYAVRSVDLKIKKGEKLAIVGENGAGKTTLVKLMCGFYYPSEGEIKLNGKEITKYNIEEYYSLFSAVFQDIYLLPVSIAEFVSSSDAEIDRDKVLKCLEQAGLGEKIASLEKGIDSLLMKGVFDDSIDMSGGEKQKLMLARALYKDAPVIILDEPTAALDPIAENELYLKYNELTSNKTSVYISHRLASTRFCDRIIFLENGEIAEMGSHEELVMLGGKYAKMYELQSHYYKEKVKNA